MSNFVRNKVICSKSFYNNYFLDPYTLGEDRYDYCNEHKYISFNKFYGVKDVNEYTDKYGVSIDYGYSYSIKELDNDYLEIKFKTRWVYLIHAIIKTIEIDHSIKWYVIEENDVYMSKFIWNNNKVIEQTLLIDTDEFNDWYDKNVIDDNIFDDIDYSDAPVWHYNHDDTNEWITWECDDFIKRYGNDYDTSDYINWYNNLNKT